MKSEKKFLYPHRLFRPVFDMLILHFHGVPAELAHLLASFPRFRYRSPSDLDPVALMLVRLVLFNSLRFRARVGCSFTGFMYGRQTRGKRNYDLS